MLAGKQKKLDHLPPHHVVKAHWLHEAAEGAALLNGGKRTNNQLTRSRSTQAPEAVK